LLRALRGTEWCRAPHKHGRVVCNRKELIE
jgi:hypothetical protein